MRRRLLAAVLAVGLVSASGCASDPPTAALSGASARQLQADVLAVTQSAAARNWTLARAELEQLTKDLAAARAAGTVSSARAISIRVAIAAVSSDIAAALATTPSATTTPVATSSHPPPSTSTKHKKHGGGGGDGGGGD